MHLQTTLAHSSKMAFHILHRFAREERERERERERESEESFSFLRNPAWSSLVYARVPASTVSQGQSILIVIGRPAVQKEFEIDFEGIFSLIFFEIHSTNEG